MRPLGGQQQKTQGVSILSKLRNANDDDLMSKLKATTGLRGLPI